MLPVSRRKSTGRDGLRAPPVGAERRPEKRRQRQRRGLFRRWLRRILVVAAVTALVPLGLSLVYRLPQVHPVSTLMLTDLLTLNGYDRRWTPLDDLGDAVVRSVMVSE